VSPQPTPGGPVLARVDPTGEENAARADPGRWLTLTELAAQTGRRREALRSWAKRGARAGRIRTCTTNRGEVQVWATGELLAGLEPGPARADLGVDPVAGRVADPGRDEEVAGLRVRVEDLLERAVHAEGGLTAELRRSADLAAALAKAEARADRLEAALAEARRPWLARVLEGLRRKG
jgi:hypothetical protein